MFPWEIGVKSMTPTYLSLRKIGLTQYKLICFIVGKWVTTVCSSNELYITEAMCEFMAQHNAWKGYVRVIDDRRSTLRTCG